MKPTKRKSSISLTTYFITKITENVSTYFGIRTCSKICKNLILFRTGLVSYQHCTKINSDMLSLKHWYMGEDTENFSA